MFSNGPKTLLYSQNGKAQISISSVSQTKELITDTRNRDQVFLATPRFVFQFAKAAVDRSCVETYETCQVELWWLLLLADNFRRQNVEVQCFVAVSLSHDKKKNEETPQHSAKILTYKNSVEKPIKIVCAIELKLH